MRKAFAVVILSVVSFFIAHPALANSSVSTVPISGSTVGNLPSAVTITTQMQLLDVGNSLTVTAVDGTRVDDGAVSIDGKSAIVGLKANSTGGVFTVSYSLLVENDVPLEGTYKFTVSEPKKITVPTVKPNSSPLKPGTATSNSSTSYFVIGLLFLAFLVLVGLSLYARKIFKNR